MKLFEFCKIYFDADDFVQKTKHNVEQYNQYTHIMHIICSAMIRNLWVASVEDFASSDVF